jgi:hypothetical protein
MEERSVYPGKNGRIYKWDRRQTEIQELPINLRDYIADITRG